MSNSSVDTGQQEMVVEGYAVMFNELSDDIVDGATVNGKVVKYKEIISPGALDDVDVSDVKCLIDHDFKQVIGRTQAETLELKIDSKGLYFKCFLPNTSYARDVYENIKVGNISQCSFWYRLPDEQGAQEWSVIDGQYVQKIHKISELVEVSIVTLPAYANTSVAVGQRTKSLEHFKEIEKLKISLELDSLRNNL